MGAQFFFANGWRWDWRNELDPQAWLKCARLFLLRDPTKIVVQTGQPSEELLLLDVGSTSVDEARIKIAMKGQMDAWQSPSRGMLVVRSPDGKFAAFGPELQPLWVGLYPSGDKAYVSFSRDEKNIAVVTLPNDVEDDDKGHGAVIADAATGRIVETADSVEHSHHSHDFDSESSDDAANASFGGDEMVVNARAGSGKFHLENLNSGLPSFDSAQTPAVERVTGSGLQVLTLEDDAPKDSAHFVALRYADLAAGSFVSDWDVVAQTDGASQSDNHGLIGDGTLAWGITDFNRDGNENGAAGIAVYRLVPPSDETAPSWWPDFIESIAGTAIQSDGSTAATDAFLQRQKIMETLDKSDLHDVYSQLAAEVLNHTSTALLRLRRSAMSGDQAAIDKLLSTEDAEPACNDLPGCWAAANRGDPVAEALLGYDYERGFLGTVNMPQAKLWYDRARAAGLDKSDPRLLKLESEK